MALPERGGDTADGAAHLGLDAAQGRVAVEDGRRLGAGVVGAEVFKRVLGLLYGVDEGVVLALFRSVLSRVTEGWWCRLGGLRGFTPSMALVIELPLVAIDTPWIFTAASLAARVWLKALEQRSASPVRQRR